MELPQSVLLCAHIEKDPSHELDDCSGAPVRSCRLAQQNASAAKDVNEEVKSALHRTGHRSKHKVHVRQR